MIDAAFYVQTGLDTFILATMAEWLSWGSRSGRPVGSPPANESQLRRLVAETRIGEIAVVLTEFFGACDDSSPTPNPWRSTIYVRYCGQLRAHPMNARYANRSEAEAGHDRVLAMLSSREFAQENAA